METKLKNTFRAIGLLCLCAAPLAYADSKLEDFSIMAVGPLDGRAVVKSPDGKLQVMKLGDTLPGTQAKLLQVLPDKLVVEDTVGKEGQPAVKQTAWIIKSNKPGEKTQVQRFDSQGPPPVVREVTVGQPVTPTKAKAKK